MIKRRPANSDLLNISANTSLGAGGLLSIRLAPGQLSRLLGAHGHLPAWAMPKARSKQVRNASV
jgi:hypothetical protein